MNLVTKERLLYRYLHQLGMNRQSIRFSIVNEDKEVYYLLHGDCMYRLVVTILSDNKLYMYCEKADFSLHNECTVEDMQEYSSVLHKVYITTWIAPTGIVTRKETSEMSKVPGYLNSKIQFQNYEYVQTYSMDKYGRICIDIQESVSIERIRNKVTKVKDFHGYSYEVYKLLHEHKFDSKSITTNAI